MARHKNPFVHRLIPTVAAASLTFACGPTDEKPDTNNGAANNGATNNGATNNGATNNGATNNGATNNGATNNGATNNGATNNGATNNGATNNGQTSDFVMVNGNETVEDAEIMAWCQAYSDCDPETFGEYYDSVTACAEEIGGYFQETLEYYSTEYSPECALVIDARGECAIGATLCVDGAFAQDPATYDPCYESFNDRYDMFCVAE